MVNQLHRTSDSATPNRQAVPQPNAAIALQHAQTCVVNQNWRQAIGYYRQAIQTQPIADTYKLLGNACSHAQRWQEAQAAYEQALHLKPDWAEVYANLGTVAAQQQQWLEALLHYRQALRLKSTLTEVEQSIEQLWHQIGQSDRSLLTMWQAFTTTPLHHTAVDHAILGNYLIEQRQLEQAIQCYQQAIELDSTLTVAHWNLATAYEQVGDRARMLEASAQALRLQPNWLSATAYCQLGNEFVRVESWQNAIACFEQAVQQESGNWQAAHYLGDAHLKLERWHDAVAAYRRSIELNPEHSWSHHNLGDALLKLERWQEAIVAYERAIELKPDFHWSHYNLGEALAKLERWDEAIKRYQQAIALQPNLSHAQTMLMNLRHQRAKADTDTVLAFYQQAIQQEPDTEQHYHKLLELQPNNGSLYYQLVEVLKRKGHFEEAKVFEQIAQQLSRKPQQNVPQAVLQDQTFRIYDHWLKLNTPNTAGLRRIAEIVPLLQYHPIISIVMPTYNTPELFLREAIQSVLDQVYPHWELCIADDASTTPHVRQILQEHAAKDARIKVVFREHNGHISQASNSALALATGEFVALLDHDDVLTQDALYEFALLLNRHPRADMIYSDEDKLDENHIRRDPFFKPDWCPDSFLSRMYVCHLGAYRRSIVQSIGGFRQGFEGSQDYDLVLRFTEQTQQIYHIPKVLYHWRIHSGSVTSGSDAKPYAYEAAKKALKEALDRREEPGEIHDIDNFLGHYRIRYHIAEQKLVSIIIPTRDLSEILDQCLTSIFTKSTYRNYEVIVVDNGSVEPATIKVLQYWTKQEPDRFSYVRFDIPFNYSQINNYGVSQAKGDYLLFLNNDTEVISPDWMEAMVEQVQRRSVGAVGALLLYPDNTIQHAGVILGLGGLAAHGHANFPANTTGYAGQVICTSNVTAVTGACLMCRREVFEAVGQFDEALAVAYNDVDLCLKIAVQGYHNVYVPHAQLYHYESKSRGYDYTPEKQERLRREAEIIRQRWQAFLDHDPCYNPNLTRDHADYSIRLPGRSLEVTQETCLEFPSDLIWTYSIDSPQCRVYPQVAFLVIQGWVIGKQATAKEIEVVCNGHQIATGLVNLSRPDVSGVYPELPHALFSGFQFILDAFEIPSVAKLELYLTLQDSTRLALSVFQVRSHPD